MTLRSGLELTIAGLRYSITGPEDCDVVERDPLYRPFLLPDSRFDLESTISLSLESEPEPSDPSVLFEAGNAWTVRRLEDGLLLRLSHHSAPGYLWAVRLGHRFDRATVHCSSLMIEETIGGRPVLTNPVHYPLDQILTMFRLSRDRGLIVHAAGVSRGGRGIFCAGTSGAGKTTLMRQWRDQPGLRGLSDDRVVVREIEGRYRMFGTPWAGEGRIADPSDAELSALTFIHHGAENCVRAISPGAALKQLLPTASILWFDPGALQRTLDFCNGLIRSVPAFEVHCRADPSAAVLLDELLPG